MRQKLLAVLVLLLPFLCAFSVTSASGVIAQNLTLNVTSTAENGILKEWGSVTLTGAKTEGVTSGDFDKHGGGLDGWRWTKEGNDYIIRDGAGNLMFTMDEAANTANNTGSCVDGPGSGDHGGTWTRGT